MKARREQWAMQRRNEPTLAPPEAAIAPMADAVKALRAAVAVLEPWLEQQEPSVAVNNWLRQMRAMQTKAVELEHFVIGKTA